MEDLIHILQAAVISDPIADNNSESDNATYSTEASPLTKPRAPNNLSPLTEKSSITLDLIFLLNFPTKAA